MSAGRRALSCAKAHGLLTIVALAASIGLLGLPSAAAAFTSTGTQPPGTTPPAQGTQSPGTFSAGDQYVETLPSTGGPKTANGKGHGGNVKLPRKIERKLLSKGGPEAPKLLEIATSTQLGAPDRKLDKGKSRNGAKRNDPSQPAVPSAAIDAVGGGKAGLGLLVLWLFVITAIALGAVGYRRYRNRDASKDASD